MCGIAGFVHLDKERRADIDLLDRMTACIRHRGPDDTGHHLDGNVALGACRLSIIDVAGGHQPLANEDGSCWVAYNGEIYNFPALREQLIGRGHQFATKCDTEVLVHAYEEEGIDFVTRLQGMFAFALWDRRTRRLVLGRDRLGIKPLYYARVDDTVIFGSEIKSLLQYPRLERRVNLAALDNLLTFEYNPSPETLFGGIWKVPAGHVLIVRDDDCELRRYWVLDAPHGDTPPLREATTRLRWELGRAVKGHLMSDVPLGVFLSGGMDSSSIVALMSQADAGPVKTFSIGFEDARDYDELAHARAVASHFKTDHHELVMKPAWFDVLPNLVWHLEEPIADEAALPLYFLSAMAKEHVKVVLVGDGGDEIFAGYGRYFWYRTIGRYTMIPRGLRRGVIEPLISTLPPLEGNGSAATLARRARRLVEIAHEPEEMRFSKWNRILHDDAKRALYSSDLLAAAAQASPFDYHQRYFAESPFDDPMSRAQYVDLKTYLVDCLLLKSDKMTSAFSLECRVPLLDPTLVEYAFSLPSSYKYWRSQSKHILREAMRGILPPTIASRRKQGFILPIGTWFKTDLIGFAREVLLDSRTLQRGYFSPAGLRQTVEGMRGGDDRFARRLYALLLFETWNRVFVDRRDEPRQPGRSS